MFSPTLVLLACLLVGQSAGLNNTATTKQISTNLDGGWFFNIEMFLLIFSGNNG